MGNSQWGPHPRRIEIEPVDARPGVVLSRRRFVELALYTSVGVILTGPAAQVARAAEPDRAEKLGTGPPACMPVVAGNVPPVEIIPYGELEEMHLLYRADLAG